VTGRLAVYLEVTPRRTFAGAVEWPGWCRSRKTPEEALEALFAYRERYARALARTRLGFTAPASLDELEVVERLKGNATTEFGAPGVSLKADDRPLDTKELKRQTAILEASWRAFDRAAEGACGIPLTKGPRGGGRDLPKMTEHVAGAEQAYLSALGSRAPGKPEALRQTVVAALAARAAGKPVADPNKVQKLWSPRFYLRRSAWHALDHAWEIEDRSGGRAA
jgi:hypothetical protein